MKKHIQLTKKDYTQLKRLEKALLKIYHPRWRKKKTRVCVVEPPEEE
jgi:hypothetical protein